MPDEHPDRAPGLPGRADLATIIYTSGTTGLPKGCQITHDNLLFDRAATWRRAPLEKMFTVGHRAALLFLPLAHSLRPHGRDRPGGDRHRSWATPPNMKNVAPDLQAFKPTFLLGVPRVFEKVYNGAEQKATADGKGKIFATAAQAAIDYSKAQAGRRRRARPAAQARRVRQARLHQAPRRHRRPAGPAPSPAARRWASGLGHFFRGVGIEVLEGYGLDGDLRAVHGQHPRRQQDRHRRQAVPGVTVRIADDKEILVKGRHVFNGYWNNEKATAEVIDVQGWFHTGDVGELDADGYLRITGRKKEILVTAAGKNVAPGPLRGQHPGPPPDQPGAS